MSSSTRYSRCGPGLALAESSGPDDDGMGCLGLGFTLGKESPAIATVIRMVDNGSRFPFPLAAYTHVFMAWPSWDSVCPGGDVIESFPPEGVQDRSLDSILGNEKVTRVHLHWFNTSQDGMARARNLGKSLLGTPYSFPWLMRWFLHHRHPHLITAPVNGRIVCSTLARQLICAATGLMPLAYTPGELYAWVYHVQSWVNDGLPPVDNLVVTER